MEFRSKKIPGNLDHLSSIANSLVMQATGKRLMILDSQQTTGTGDGAATLVEMPLILIPKSVNARWRVVGVGGYIYADGVSTKAEIIKWGYNLADLGVMDPDAFGSFTQDTAANKQVKDGDFIFQAIASFEDYFGFDVPENEGSHTWDISGAGAGVMMGVWQTKSTQLIGIKENVAGSTATLYPFFLVEYELGGGVT